jgi:capsid assembly protease
MSRREEFLGSLKSEVWAIREEAIISLFRRAESDDDESETKKSAWSGRWSPRVENSVGIVPIFGVMGYRRSSGWWYDSYTETLSESIDEFANAGDVSAIVLDIDSPGGTVAGVKELSSAINSAKQRKPVIAVANPEAASAAYWIGSQATEFVATTSAEVGSIGVWTAHSDLSGMLEKAGIKITLVSAGRYKVEGHPYGPLDEDARAEMQRGVDVAYDDFLSAVANGRRVPRQMVRDSFGQGRMLESDRALSAGMIDRISSFSAVVSEHAKTSARNRLRRVSLDIALTESAIRR